MPQSAITSQTWFESFLHLCSSYISEDAIAINDTSLNRLLGQLYEFMLRLYISQIVFIISDTQAFHDMYHYRFLTMLAFKCYYFYLLLYYISRVEHLLLNQRSLVRVPEAAVVGHICE